MKDRFSKHRSNRSRSSQRPGRSLKRLRFGVPRKERVPEAVRQQRPYLPPEEWFEPSDEPTAGFTTVVRQPGEGYLHVVSPEEVDQRLGMLPVSFLEPLEYVCFSEITRKKSRAPLYGMQWGATIYLYPMLDTLEEFFGRPPSPAQRIEAKMYGASWSEPEPGTWKLSWTEGQLKDFYLNNVLIHELGHLLDERNSSVTDRERYAEWFAIEYGYKPSRGKDLHGTPCKRSRRRHHRK